MSDIHAGAFHPVEFGLCGWRHHHCGVWLSCDSTAFPGDELCVDHMIAAAHTKADLESAAAITASRILFLGDQP